MKALILAGGFGNRLRPLTDDMPKPMLPVKGTPLLYTCVKKILNAGIDDISIALYYLPERVIEYFKDGEDFGCKISYKIETSPLGTGGAIKNFQEHLSDGAVLVFNGDIYSDIDLTELIKIHKQNVEAGALATISIVQVENPSRFGTVRLDDVEGSRKILEFAEKSPTPPSNWINSGIYMFEPEVFNYIPDISEKPMIERTAFPELAKKLKLAYYKIPDGVFWSDIGTKEDYDRVNNL